VDFAVPEDAMKERFAEISTPAGTMKTFIAHPEQDGPFPPVIFYMDFWGVREELFDIARRVAVVGYYCMVPDLYYRQGTVHNEILDEQGKMISLNRVDAATRERVLAPTARFKDAEAMEDTRAILEYLKNDASARPGAKGCVGYCIGGRLAMRAAGTFPEHFKASASLHGTDLVTEDEDSVHKLASQIQGEVYCGFAENDRYASPQTVVEIASAMKRSAAKYHYEIHPGTEHGYALPNRNIHHKKATLRDWELILPMFHRQISACQV
jgi:carboxymethylenebutenolidase